MWHPNNEAEACSDGTAFIEWLRATRGMEALDPATLAAWSVTEPDAYQAAMTKFLALSFRPPSSRPDER